MQPWHAYRGSRSWLVLAGDIGGHQGVLSGDVSSTDVSVQQGMFSSSVSLACELDKAVLRTGQRYQGEQVALGSLLWEALQTWPDENAGRRWPPEMLALLALARKYPQEYEHLRESEAELRALGG
jgi:hypothetical protein